MTRPLTVSFCCNNDQGTNSGRFCAIEFSCGEPGDADANLSLDAIHLDECDKPTIQFRDAFDVIAVAGTVYDVEHFSHRIYVGNMAWDSVRMPHDAARKLCEALLESEACVVDEFDIDHPFSDLDARCQ